MRARGILNAWFAFSRLIVGNHVVDLEGVWEAARLCSNTDAPIPAYPNPYILLRAMTGQVKRQVCGQALGQVFVIGCGQGTWLVVRQVWCERINAPGSKAHHGAGLCDRLGGHAKGGLCGSFSPGLRLCLPVQRRSLMKRSTLRSDGPIVCCD